MNPATSSKSARLAVRTTKPVKQLLQEAARAAHKNVSEFVLDAAIAAAGQVLADRRRFELPAQQQEAFEANLGQPASAKPKLQQLINQPGLLG